MSYISKDPRRCGGEACVRDTRITVWGLVRMRELDAPDAAILFAHPDLTPADLVAAMKYADEHHQEIDHAIVANERDNAAAWREVMSRRDTGRDANVTGDA